ncbi:UNVERIFIED_CONTAM: sensor histidine kinase regulating citrate/malate metabolism [Paenibacillus sp. PvR008]
MWFKRKSKPRRQFKVSLQFMINKHFDNTKEKLSGIAKVIASDSDVIRNVEQGVPVKQIQDYSLRVMNNVNVDFVVILNRNLIRLYQIVRRLGCKYITEVVIAGFNHVG